MAIMTQKDRMMFNRVNNILYKAGHEDLKDQLYEFYQKIEKLDNTLKKLYGGK